MMGMGIGVGVGVGVEVTAHDLLDSEPWLAPDREESHT